MFWVSRSKSRRQVPVFVDETGINTEPWLAVTTQQQSQISWDTKTWHFSSSKACHLSCRILLMMWNWLKNTKSWTTYKHSLMSIEYWQNPNAIYVQTFFKLLYYLEMHIETFQKVVYLTSLLSIKAWDERQVNSSLWGMSHWIEWTATISMTTFDISATNTLQQTIAYLPGRKACALSIEVWLDDFGRVQPCVSKGWLSGEALLRFSDFYHTVSDFQPYSAVVTGAGMSNTDIWSAVPICSRGEWGSFPSFDHKLLLIKTENIRDFCVPNMIG